MALHILHHQLWSINNFFQMWWALIDLLSLNCICSCGLFLSNIFQKRSTWFHFPIRHDCIWFRIGEWESSPEFLTSGLQERRHFRWCNDIMLVWAVSCLWLRVPCSMEKSACNKNAGADIALQSAWWQWEGGSWLFLSSRVRLALVPAFWKFCSAHRGDIDGFFQQISLCKFVWTVFLSFPTRSLHEYTRCYKLISSVFVTSLQGRWRKLG